MSRILRSSLCLLIVGCTLCSAFTSICKKEQSLALSAKRSIQNNNKNIGILETCERQTEKICTSSVNFVPAGDFVWTRAFAIFASVVMTTSVLQPVPASLAASPTLNEAIVELSETSYPILQALDPVPFGAFSTKIGDFFLKNIKQEKLAKSIELGIDALDSAPSEKLAEFNVVLKEAYAGVDVDSCRKVPLPPKSIVDKFGGIAAESVDPEKLKTFGETWKPSLEALEKIKTNDDTICLPASRASLDKLALAQADLARNFGKAETKAFVSYTGPVLKSSVTISKALSWVNDAKTLAPTATPQAKKEFAAVGKKVESASQLEIARNKIAEQKAKQENARNKIAEQKAKQAASRAAVATQQ